MRAAIIIGGLVLVTLGCGPPSPQVPPDPSAQRGEPTRPAHSPSNRTGLLSELDRQWSRWIKDGPLMYRLAVSRRCFCKSGTPWVSRVEGASIANSQGGYYSDTGENIGPPLRRVEQLFGEATRLAKSDADEVAVEFDQCFGYPVRISIDPWRGVIDDEFEWIAELTVVR